jgi:predicted metal-binding membrane protein
MAVVAATAGLEISRRMASDRPSEAALVGVSALLFAGSATLTIAWCTSMSAIGGMPMPGGWTMSMAWMRMPGQTWPGAAASFLGMWVVMMVAMMLPSLVPMLRRYREAVGRTAASAPTSPCGLRRGLAVALRAEEDKATASCAEATRRRGAAHLGALTATVGAGYFFVWTVFGMAVFPLGTTLAELEMQQPALARAVPIGVGVVVLIAGALQFSPWKARHLACCREASASARADVTANYGETWRYGLRLGLHCSQCCAGPMAILLVMGVMDLRAMAVVAAAITVERLAPAGEHIARAIGVFVIGAGLFLTARAAGLGTP